MGQDNTRLAEQIERLARELLDDERAELLKRHPLLSFEVGGDTLTLRADVSFVAASEGADVHAWWVIEWRGDRRRAGAGELALLEGRSGRRWWLLLPEKYGRMPKPPAEVPVAFDDAAVVDWRPAAMIGGSFPRDTRDRCAIGLCGERLRKLVRGGDIEQEERKYTHARSDHRKAHKAATAAAAHLEKALERLCSLEDKRPSEDELTHALSLPAALWEAATKRDSGPSRRRNPYSRPLPPSQRSKGAHGSTLHDLCRMAALIRGCLPSHARPRHKRGNSGDFRKAAVRGPLRAMGLGDTEVSRVLRWLELERWNAEETTAAAQLRGRRLNARGFARERARADRNRSEGKKRGKAGPSIRTRSSK